MASLKQLGEIFAPILADHPDLVLHRRWLFRPPIETAIIGLYIDRTSSANNSAMWLSVVPLSRFNSPWVHGFKEAFEIEHIIGAPPERWSTGVKDDSPRIYQDMFSPDYPSQLMRNFNAKVRPFLDNVRAFDDVVEWIRRFREPPLRSRAIELIDGWLAAMRGDFAAAADQLQAYLEGKASYGRHNAADDNRQLHEDTLKVLRDHDQAAIATFLHDLEQRSITKFGLERFWRHTPFPFER